MRQYFRESRKLPDGTRRITHYTPGEYFILNLIKLAFYLCIVWPVQLAFLLLQVLFYLVVEAFKLAGRAIKWVYNKIKSVGQKPESPW